ncbi:hypothetical protein ABPG77_001820 [Micractinium sp. CCAP 211/92]
MACTCSSLSAIADRKPLSLRRGGRSSARQQRRVAVRAGLVETLIRPVLQIGERLPLKEGIASFYDESSQLWESMWGEHMHHGYYPKGGAPKSNQQAQIDMIEETLKWAGVTGASKMVDVGCGIGGSSRHISRKFGCEARGITLSPFQAARANELAAAQGLGDKLQFQVADALQQPFADGEFDLVWSMESGEHMPDKHQFVRELARVCAPGGRIIIVTWCHRWGPGRRLCPALACAAPPCHVQAAPPACRWNASQLRASVHGRGQAGFLSAQGALTSDPVHEPFPAPSLLCSVLAPGEAALAAEEQSLLDRICEAYYLPAWCSIADYERLFREQGLTDIKTADWSEEVAPFWGEVIKSAFTAEGIGGLLRAGWTTIKGALVMPLMAEGFRMGLVKFVLITARKPE